MTLLSRAVALPALSIALLVVCSSGPANVVVSNRTVNLVIASLEADDISWTSKLTIPNLSVIPYLSDSPTANMLFTLSQLDLDVVQRRQYANLRVDWDHTCPDWINTTKTPQQSVKQEEPLMQAAFRANFDVNVVPEILAGPCCSQFAVTKEAILRHGRAQYKRNMDWLIRTSLSDYLSGRVWEHMWSYLFKQDGVDCPGEWETYCGIERKALEEDTEFWRELLNPQAGVRARKRIEEIEKHLEGELANALERGEKDGIRAGANAILLGDEETLGW
ncbi:hypothetical protein QBC40DRAFT_343149 [Triangularia verruculosa]|uniref:Uncharacterized protein n=1 Tax=Triangularia verruculosa TaxID=2587418 RepID=A0AAN6X8D5_9PEZI|nr:hypothetical protein QBC40DRAFT_343149 [Triangularia verruculosa]